jgi:hypothetical protein
MINILGNKLKIPCSILAGRGAPLTWTVDQILRSDIRPGDFVILGTVPDNRLAIWSNSGSKPIFFNAANTKHINFNRIDIPKSAVEAFLVSDNIFYENILHIHQVINFCQKVRAKLMILGLKTSNTLLVHLNNIPEFVNYKNFESPDRFYIDYGIDDYGIDGEHPGPLQHQLYADFCYATLKKLNYI